MLGKYLKMFIVGLFLVLAGIQANKYFVLDEIDFPIVSHATSQSGKPIYYRGEDSPKHVGTYHPTLYINLLAIFIRLFGFSEISVRLFGVICVLASSWFLILIMRQLKINNSRSENIILGLFLLNPYTIANTTLPDIDSTILPPIILLFTLLTIKFVALKTSKKQKYIVILGFVMALALWSKLTTSLILPPLLLAANYLQSKNIKQSIIISIKVTLIGVIVFMSTYFLYCIALGLSPTYTYKFLLESFTKGTNAVGPFKGALMNLQNTGYFIYWLGVPFTFVLILSNIGILSDIKKDKIANIKILLSATALLVTFFYIALISPFGGFFKYPFPVFGIMLLSIVFYFDKYAKNYINKPLLIILALVLGFLVNHYWYRDYAFMGIKPFGDIILFTALLTVCAIMLHKYKGHKYGASLLSILLFFAIGFQLSTSRIQAISNYSTKYLYGQTGLMETTSYLKQNTNQDEIIWAMKDVGYYTNNRYIESYAYYFDSKLESELINLLKNGEVRYYVASVGIGQDNLDYYNNIKSILEKYAVKDRQFGNYIIYKVKDRN